MKPTKVDDNSDRAASACNRQTLPDAMSIGERVRRATLAATALHLIEVRRASVCGDKKPGEARNTGDLDSAA